MEQISLIIGVTSPFSGLGTFSNPFILQSYYIQAYNTINSPGAAIYITNTNSYFQIKSCDCENTSSQVNIYLNNVTNGYLYNNICPGWGNGIELENCWNITISQNQCNGNSTNGIQMISL